MFSSSKPKPRNPYHHITAIHDPVMFFGRKRTLEHIYALVEDKQNIALVGPRRIGKSSILSCMQFPEFQRRFTGVDLSTYVFIHIDLEEHRQKTVENFLKFTSRQLIRKVSRDLPANISLVTDTDSFSDLLDVLNDYGFYPILMLDELDCITCNTAFGPDFFMFLRSLANLKKVSYITASLAPLETLSHSGLMGSPFFNIFDFCTIGPLAQDDAIQLIAEPAQAKGCPFTEAEIKTVLELGGRHPFFIQRICYLLFEEKVSGNTTNPNIKEVSVQAYNQLKPHLEYIWQHLTVEQQEEIKNEVRHQISQFKAMAELSESALFRQFVHRQSSLADEPPQITPVYLKKALEKIYDYTFLSESKLGYLNIVYTQIKTNASSRERGIEIHRFLKSAIDSLKPKDPSFNLESRSYFILRNCYLDKGLTNEQIAARLSISERTFYRDRDKAIEDLLNMLLEREHIQ